MMIAEKSLVEHAEVPTAVTHKVLVAKECYSLPTYIMNIVTSLPGNHCSPGIVDWLHPLPLFSHPKG
jgi:hypothetical protein